MILSRIRLTIAALLTTLAVAAGGTLYYQSQLLKKARHEAATATTRAEQLETALHAEKRARVAQTIARRKAQAQLKESQRALDQVHKAAPAWADEPLPPAVSDWVRQHGQDPSTPTP